MTMTAPQVLTKLAEKAGLDTTVYCGSVRGDKKDWRIMLPNYRGTSRFIEYHQHEDGADWVGVFWVRMAHDGCSDFNEEVARANFYREEMTLPADAVIEFIQQSLTKLQKVIDRELGGIDEVTPQPAVKPLTVAQIKALYGLLIEEEVGEMVAIMGALGMITTVIGDDGRLYAEKPSSFSKHSLALFLIGYPNREKVIEVLQVMLITTHPHHAKHERIKSALKAIG